MKIINYHKLKDYIDEFKTRVLAKSKGPIERSMNKFILRRLIRGLDLTKKREHKDNVKTRKLDDYRRSK